MKKTLKLTWIVCLFLIAAVFALASCGVTTTGDSSDKTTDSTTEDQTPNHVHTEVVDPAVSPTCTEPGLTLGKHCSECGEVTVAQQTIDALGHVEVVQSGSEPTCTRSGLTEGKYCSVCSDVILEQTTIDALGHTEVIDEAVAPTCSVAGLTEGKHCSVCNATIVAQTYTPATGHTYEAEVTPPTCISRGYTTHTCINCDSSYVNSYVSALGHTEVVDAGTAPTCTTAGTTENRYCSVCNVVLAEPVLVPALGHTVVIDKGVSATCTSEGLTEGKHCSTCDEIIVAQTVAPALGHNIVVTKVGTPATCTEPGMTDEKYCTNCKRILEYQTSISAIGHSYVVENAVAATCISSGLTEGKYCSVCDHVESVQEYVAAYGHSYALKIVVSNKGIYANVCTKCNTREEVSVITYAAYGAKGDGKTDDSVAIRRAHDAANYYGLPVEGEAGATYYIGTISQTITVKTDTDWKGAKFIFDDRQIRWDDTVLRNIQVFTVAPDTAARAVTVPTSLKNNGLKKGQTNIGMTFSESCMIKIENSGERIYKRIGVNATSGAYKNEMILVDKNGNVDPSTPIQYDYSSITTIIVYSIDENPIRVGNATFTTIAPNPKEQDPDFENNNTCFFNRGLCVERSNTTVYDVEHIVENEMMTIEIDRNNDGVIDKWGADKSYGITYNGFYVFNNAYNVTMQDCIVEGHQAYSFWQDLNGVSTRNEVGNYDITASRCVNLNFIRVIQYENEETGEVITNRFMYHGIMGTSWCRNMVLDGCYLDRFDSHQGMHNATLKNSTFGFGILPIGGGTLHIENVKRISGSAFIHLRMDYNSYFNGDVKIINCEMSSSIGSIVEGNWLEHHCGLPNHMTNSLIIDGLTVDRNKICLYSIQFAAVETLTNETNPLILPTYVEVNGVKKLNGSSVGVEKSAYNDAFMQIPLEMHVHTWGEGEIVESSSSASCKTNRVIYTCTDPDCGLTMESIVASSTPHTTLTHTISSEGYITYTCGTCGCSYTPSFSYVNDGSDYNAIEGSSNADRGYVTAAGTHNPVINANGEYELLKANSDSATQMELWIPSKSYSLDELSSANNAIGFFSFKINAYTDSSIQMKFIDAMANTGDNRWKEGGCITEDFFKVSSPVTSGFFTKKTQVTISGWDWSKKIDITNNSDKFTGWIDVKIMIELNSATDKVTAHYYIDGTYVGSASRTLTTTNNTISAVYISGKNTAQGTGIKLDDVAFGCFYGNREE